MSLDIQGKLAKGEKLTDEEVRYAADREIALPEEYDDAVKAHKGSIGDDGAAQPVFQTGDAFAQPQQGPPGLFLSQDDLSGMTKDMLVTLGEAAGVEVSGTKSDMIAQLSGAEVSESEDDEEDEG